MQAIRETYDLNARSDFGPTLDEVRRKHAERLVSGSGEKLYETTEHILYRGQANAQWDLATTLERRTDEAFSVYTYMDAATRYAEEIEAFTGKSWPGTGYSELRKSLDHFDPLHASLPCYEFLVYLRHHGFASPLLDWTRSPYIAAFFALATQSTSERAAVFAFIETPDGGKSTREGRPTIRVLGPFTFTHRRHFAQQAEYTIATTSNERDHWFC